MNKTSKFHFEFGTISWQKEIYKDKIVTLKNMLISNDSDNILECKDERMKKNIINVIRTLGKQKFTIQIKDGNSFSFKPFNSISEDNIELGCFRVELDANDTAINRGQQQFNLVRAIDTTKRLSAHYSIVIKDQLEIKPHIMLGGIVTIRDKSATQAVANLTINKTISTKLLNVIYTR